jgi:Flp pilus assembly protein TadG
MRSLLPFRRTGRRRTRGQSLVEFALILPVLLVMLAAALDLGRVFYAHITLNNAAREGAFEAAANPESFDAGQPCNTTTNRVVCRVQLEAKDSNVTIDAADIDVDCSVTGCPEQSGSLVTVSVSGEFQLITPLLAVIFGGQTIPLSSTATAQVEYLPDAALITAPPGPVAGFTVSDSSPDVGELVSFDGSSSTGDPSEYVWDFGDGAQDQSTDPAMSHTYTVAGTYTVILTVINLTGVDTEQHTVTVGTPPGPSASASPSNSAPPPPDCIFPANVIGLAPGVARDQLDDNFVVVMWADLSTGPKNKIQAQNPDHTECLDQWDPIELHYRPL